MATLHKKVTKKSIPAKDLRDELEAALQGDFQFNGSFYCAQKLSTAPNPCLNIEGAGPVGLPLSERDPKAIIQVAKQAPFGHGTETVVDKSVRDTWEIEPSQLKFDNPAWVNFVETRVVNTVWAGLGVTKPTSTPKCELYKLLVYEPGSHFLPHQDTEKAAGMFATVVILLPSPYQGGQVHVTHASKTEVIDLSENSHLSTSVLAWYTDVTHEVKPITSGYRLALAYNLIHTSHPDTIPHLPRMGAAVSKVRTVLEKWRQSPFKDEKRKMNLLAYLLEHQYNNHNLRVGARVLKGQDAHLVAHVRAAAEASGYMVLLGALEYHLQGSGDDEGYGNAWGKKCRYGDSDSDEDEYNDDDVGFMEIYERELKVENVVDLDGHDMIGGHVLELGEDSLVPKDPFEDVDPDERQYEGYMGNGAGELDHWYRRTVLILVHKDDADGIFLEVGGISYALSKIREKDPDQPTEENKKLMEFIIKGLKASDAKIAREAIVYAVRWRSLEYWNAIVLKAGFTIATLDPDQLVPVLEAFTFEEVRLSFERLLQRPQSLKDRIRLIDAIQAKVGSEDAGTVSGWCDTWSLQALGTFVSPKEDDIPALINAAKRRGTAFLSSVILPQLLRSANYFGFMVAFIKSLQQNREAIPTATASASPPVDWDTIMHQCLEIISSQCEAIQIHSYIQWGPDRTAEQLKTYSQVFELCITAQQVGPCSKLCQNLLAVSGNVPTKFSKVFVPFVAAFGTLCRKTNFDILTPPFDDLLRRLVSSYLHSILKSSSTEHLSKVRKLGCGCSDCEQLDNFITDSTRKQHAFKAHQTVRSHIEKRIRSAYDLLTYETIRSGIPHTLEVKKHAGVASAQQWPTRLANAKAFLANIGDDAVIARLMGERFPDVQAAMSGTQRFADIQPTPNSTSATPATTAPDILPTASTAQKRKQPGHVVDHGVIDLT